VIVVVVYTAAMMLDSALVERRMLVDPLPSGWVA